MIGSGSSILSASIPIQGDGTRLKSYGTRLPHSYSAEVEEFEPTYAGKSFILGRLSGL